MDAIAEYLGMTTTETDEMTERLAWYSNPETISMEEAEYIVDLHDENGIADLWAVYDEIETLTELRALYRAAVERVEGE